MGSGLPQVRSMELPSTAWTFFRLAITVCYQIPLVFAVYTGMAIIYFSMGTICAHS